MWKERFESLTSRRGASSRGLISSSPFISCRMPRRMGWPQGPDEPYSFLNVCAQGQSSFGSQLIDDVNGLLRQATTNGFRWQ